MCVVVFLNEAADDAYILIRDIVPQYQPRFSCASLIDVRLERFNTMIQLSRNPNPPARALRPWASLRFDYLAGQ